MSDRVIVSGSKCFDIIKICFTGQQLIYNSLNTSYHFLADNHFLVTSSATQIKLQTGAIFES